MLIYFISINIQEDRSNHVLLFYNHRQLLNVTVYRMLLCLDDVHVLCHFVHVLGDNCKLSLDYVHVHVLCHFVHVLCIMGPLQV